MPAELQISRSLSLRKRLLFCGVLLVLLGLFVEASALGMHRLRRGSWFNWRAMREQRAAISGSETSAGFAGAAPEDAVHPYLGYVRNPEFRPKSNVPTRPITDFGYHDGQSPVQRREKGKCIVAVVGGSVARDFSFYCAAFAEKLSQSESFSGTSIQVINLAVGGYKQPQQLMTINYLLALGAEFDIVINIDGFNEVALHEPENGRLGTFPIYPRNWPRHVAGIPDKELQQDLRDRDSVGERRRGLARICSYRLLRDSVVCNLVWEWRDRIYSQELQEIEQRIRTKAKKRTQYLETGPKVAEFAEGDVYQHLAGIWLRSSLQLHRLCQANGIRYYHFLQPNQYVAGSKAMNPDERALAFSENHEYRPGVEKGYPVLIEKGRDLVDAGVNFVDLTQIFAGLNEALYRDTCCHVNPRGNEILIDHVARALASDANTDITMQSESTIR